MSAMAEVVKALIDRLKADPGVGALIGDRIWEGSAPTGTQKPFVTVDSPTESTRFTLGGKGYSDTVLAHAHSGQDSLTELAALIPAIEDAVALPLNLGALGTVRLKYESGLILPDGNGRTAPLRFRTFAMGA